MAGSTCLSREGEGRYRCPDPDSMRALGGCLGEALAPGDVVILTGDLGAGKTCLTGGVVASVGGAGPVTSPTFSIMCVHGGGRLPVYHFDLYRLEDASQLEDTGIYDLLEADGACLVEWGEAYADELADERLELELTREAAGPPGGQPARRVLARGVGEAGRRLLRALDLAVERAVSKGAASS